MRPSAKKETSLWKCSHCGISGDKMFSPIFILVYTNWENLLIHSSLWFSHCLELEFNLMPLSGVQDFLDTRCLGRATVEVWRCYGVQPSPQIMLYFFYLLSWWQECWKEDTISSVRIHTVEERLIWRYRNGDLELEMFQIVHLSVSGEQNTIDLFHLFAVQ